MVTCVPVREGDTRCLAPRVTSLKRGREVPDEGEWLGTALAFTPPSICRADVVSISGQWVSKQNKTSAFISSNELTMFSVFALLLEMQVDSI